MLIGSRRNITRGSWPCTCRAPNRTSRERSRSPESYERIAGGGGRNGEFAGTFGAAEEGTAFEGGEDSSIPVLRPQYRHLRDGGSSDARDGNARGRKEGRECAVGE